MTTVGKSMMFDIPGFYGALTANLTPLELCRDNSDDSIRSFLLGKTEVIIIDKAFMSDVDVGINYNIEQIIKALRIVVDYYIGNNPEGSVYILLPQTKDISKTNYHLLLQELVNFDVTGNIDFVLLLETMSK